MLNIKSFISLVKKHKLLSLFIVIGLFLIPLIVVHFLFKWYSGHDIISSEWSAGDLIGYIAGFEAFIGTVVLGTIAVWQSDKANNISNKLLYLTKENERKSILPFLSFNLYIPKYEGNNIASYLAKALHGSSIDISSEEYIPLEDTMKRVDFLISELTFTVYDDIIKISNELCKEHKEKIKSELLFKKYENSNTFAHPDYHYDKIYVENCGKGSAINVLCRLCKIGNEKDDKLDIYSIPFTVPVEKHFDLGLYFDLTKKYHGSYKLEFTYCDIYMNKYLQTIPLELTGKEGTIDLYQPQILLEEKCPILANEVLDECQ